MGIGDAVPCSTCMHKQSLTRKQCRGRGGPIWARVSGLRICSRPMKVREKEEGAEKEGRKLKLTVGSSSPWHFSYATAAPSPAFISHPDIYVQPGRPMARERAGGGEGGQSPRLKQNRCMTSCC
ncbi:hypothetical protein QQF64_005109 [Cirrhinus molitorella]|uniref:Uncharacterized protein n=1 Tax=Cirrhinus molitorella TaxID=172907 RepID=A0ABR3MI41_9TELE